jgi:hypothetical protein
MARLAEPSLALESIRKGVNKGRNEILALHINKYHYNTYKGICISFTLPNVWKNSILNTK